MPNRSRSRNEKVFRAHGRKMREELMFVSVYPFFCVRIEIQKLAYSGNFEIHAFM